MKTLADLKRNAHKYQWAMISNSWFNELRPELTAFREVHEVRNKDISFYTEKETGTTISYCDFPKAKNLKIEEGKHVDKDGWITPGFLVTFKGEEKDDCTLTYFLINK